MNQILSLSIGPEDAAESKVTSCHGGGNESCREILALSCEAAACEAELMLCPAPSVDIGLLNSSNNSLHISAISARININALPIIIIRGK